MSHCICLVHIDLRSLRSSGSKKNKNKKIIENKSCFSSCPEGIRQDLALAGGL